ncbi:MAG: hypothetical protein ACI8ZB_004817 [Desulforhopalus sp.]|jgi:hypothetical protein
MKFYRNIFAIACFACFLTGITMDAPYAFIAAMIFGMLSRTAERKGWSDPFQKSNQQ